MAETVPALDEVDASDPVALLRAALERTTVLARDPVELRDIVEAPPDLTLFEVVRFGESDPEQLRDATISMLGALSAARTHLVLWVRGDGKRLRLFWGRLDRRGQPSGKDVVVGALTGFLPGTHIQPVDKLGALQRVLENGLGGRQHAVLVAGIPSDREGSPSARSLDQALDALARTSFDLIVVARPVAHAALDLAETNLALTINMARAIGRATTVISSSETYSEAFRESQSAARTLTVTESLTSTAGERRVKTKNEPGGHAIGAMAGAIVGGVAGFVVAGPAGATVGLSAGAMGGSALGGALAPGGQRSEETSRSFARGSSDSRTDTSQTTIDASAHKDSNIAQQVTIENVVSSAQVLAETAEAHRKRLERGRGLGMWRTSVRVAADDVATANRVAQLLIGAVRGDTSHLGPLAVLDLAEPPRAIEAIARFHDLQSRRPAHFLLPEGEQPDTWLTSGELALYMRPPSAPVSTLDVRAPVHFGRWLPATSERRSESAGAKPQPMIELGHAVAAEREIGPLRFPASDLCRHAFVSGTTGAGKTNTVKVILQQLADQDIPFLVLEPAKTEYRDLFDDLERRGRRPLRFVLGEPRRDSERAFRFNPLRAPQGIPVGRHLEAVKTLVLGSFDMHEGLPQAMEALLFRAFARMPLTRAMGRWAPVDHPTLPG